MTLDMLMDQVREAVTQLERENAELRRDVKRLADQNGDLCDQVHALREQLNDHEEGRNA